MAEQQRRVAELEANEENEGSNYEANKKVI